MTSALSFHRSRLREAQAELKRKTDLGFPVVEQQVAIAEHKRAIDVLEHSTGKDEG